MKPARRFISCLPKAEQSGDPVEKVIRVVSVAPAEKQWSGNYAMDIDNLPFEKFASPLRY